MHKPLSIASAIVALVFSATMPLRGQSALNRFDPNANRGAGNGSERITESVRNAPIAGPATPTPSPPPQMVSLSTRMRVQTGDNVGVAGFIIAGSAAKHVLLRAIGPSLTQFGVPNALADPTLELHGPPGFTTIVNDNWRDTQEAEIQATGIPPTNDLESAIAATLAPGSYVAIVKGKNNTSGIGLIEVYDLEQPAASRLANLSTRGFVSTGSDIVIAGFLLSGNNVTDRIVVRGIGPSLAPNFFPVSAVLADPTLELRDSNGTLLIANNDWQDNPAQAAELVANGLAPTNNLESGIAAMLPPGLYTALLAGLNNGTGLGVVEVYDRGVGGGPVPTPTPPGATPSPTPPGGTPSPTPPGGTPSPTTTPGGTPTPTPAPPVITSPLDVTVTMGQLFVYQFEAIGATSLGVTNPPPGLTFDSALRAIVGYPALPGAYSTGLSATNAGGTDTETLNITVQPTPSPGPSTFTSTAATGRTGRPFSFQVMTRGGTSSTRLTATGLPPGLTVGAATGLILGTPTSDGTFAVTLTATDGSVMTMSTLQLTFTSDPTFPVIVSPNAASLIPGQFFSYTIATDAPGATNFTYFGTLPTGLTFDAATGTISGIYPGLRGKGVHAEPAGPDLTGGDALSNIQLFGTNLSGTSTIQFFFRDTRVVGLGNISTLTNALTGDNGLIGGFIVTGDTPKIVIVRAIGPSLAGLVTGPVLQDPTLELEHIGHPEDLIVNDNWKDSQRVYIEISGFAPRNTSESAIIIALDPGNYTAKVKGKNNSTGLALVEVYDLGIVSINGDDDPPPISQIGNLSTRGFTGTGSEAMTGGFVISGATTRVIVRAIGPSLDGFVPGYVEDPTLELKNAQGDTIRFNNDWRMREDGSSQEDEIRATGLQPSKVLESATVENLAPGNYTAIVRGDPSAPAGVALVEVYKLPPP
jgi:hypothetical protein